MENFIWRLKMMWFGILKLLGLRKSNIEITVVNQEVSEDEVPPEIKAQILKKYGHL